MSAATGRAPDDVTASATAEPDERPSLQTALRKLAEGELGSLRVLIVLAVIWTVFAFANDSFLTCWTRSPASAGARTAGCDQPRGPACQGAGPCVCGSLG